MSKTAVLNELGRWPTASQKLLGYAHRLPDPTATMTSIPAPDPIRAVAALALEAKVSVAEVARLYEENRAELESSARIKSFLPIFAMRNVQEVLRRRTERAPIRSSARKPALSAG